MSKKQNSRMDQIDGFVEDVALATASGDIDKPNTRFMLRQVMSKLDDGKHAAEAHMRNQNRYGPRAKMNQLRAPRFDRWPDYSKQDPFFLGHDVHTGEAIDIPGQDFTRHFLAPGSTGAGKSTVFRRVVAWCAKRLIPVLFMDHKDDGRKLLALFESIIIISVKQIYENLIAPIGDPEAYFAQFFSEIGARSELHPGTEDKMVEVACSMQDGLSDGDDPFSLKDYEDTLAKIAESGSDQALFTGLRAIRSFNRNLGPAAEVRRGPGVECGKWLIVVMECLGVEPDFLASFSSIRLMRFMLHAREHGHSGDLQSVYISDDGQCEFGKQFQSRTSSKRMTAPERLITQVRSMGRAVFVGIQHLWGVMSILPANAGSLLCFEVQDEKDARLSANLLGMRTKEQKEALWDHPLEYCAWFKSVGGTQARLIRLEDMPSGPVPSTDEVKRRMAPSIEWLEANSTFSPSTGRKRTPIYYKEFLGEVDPDSSKTDVGSVPVLIQEEVTFLLDVVATPSIGVKQRYKGLGISADKGRRIRDALLDQELIEVVKSRTPGRSSMHLRITSKGQELLDGLS